MRLLIVLAVALGPPRVAVASAENALVIVRGGATERDQLVVGTSIEKAVRDAGWSLPAKPPAKKDVEAVLKCAESPEPWSCLPKAQPELRRLFVIGVENEQSQTGVPMVVVNAKVMVAETKTVIARQRFCSQCADDKLGVESAGLANQILRELAVRSGRTIANIKSKPSGARIILDGTAIAVTDASFPTYPGKHHVRIEKPGFLAHDAEFAVEEGKTAEVAVELRPTDLGGPSPITPPSLLVPKLVIGAGIALVVGGGVLFVLDADVGETGSQTETFRNTAGYGVGYMIAGAAVTAGGVYWWYVRKSRTRSAPTASVLPGGATLGWLGTF